MHTSAESTFRRAGAHTLDRLIGLTAAGDRDAFSELYELAKTPVYGFALSYLKDTHDAEDVLQDVFLRLWSSAPNYESEGKPMAWILTVTKNLALSKLRERGRFADGEIAEQAYHMPPVEDSVVLTYALSALSEDEARIVTLHAVAGFRHREIAAMLALPLSTVLSKYSRAMKKLRTHFKEDGNE